MFKIHLTFAVKVLQCVQYRQLKVRGSGVADPFYALSQKLAPSALWDPQRLQSPLIAHVRFTGLQVIGTVTHFQFSQFNQRECIRKAGPKQHATILTMTQGLGFQSTVDEAVGLTA